MSHHPGQQAHAQVWQLHVPPRHLHVQIRIIVVVACSFLSATQAGHTAQVEVLQPGSALLQEETPPDCTPVITIGYSVTCPAPSLNFPAPTLDPPSGDAAMPDAGVLVLEHANMAR